jgi:DNA-binding NarL/FixJ family response regulator
MIRQGLSAMLLDEPDLELVGEAADGVEAVERVESLAPDVVLMDFSMPNMNGLEATRRITQRWPHVRVVGLSMYEEADRAQAMLDAGACAYLSKTVDAEVLLGVIRTTGAEEPTCR